MPLPLRSARQDALSDEEIIQLLYSSRGIRDEFVVTVPLYCGLRVSELAHLNASWLDWSGSWTSIWQRRTAH